MKRPDFIGIGAPRAGTNFLYETLAEHPEVSMSTIREPHYFIHPDIWGSFDNYCRCFEQRTATKVYGEISTQYISNPEVPMHIKRELPDVKIVASVRHPADQIYSLYWEMRVQNFYSHSPIDGEVTFCDAIDRFPHLLIPPVKHGTNLKRWIDVFGRDQVCIVFHEDIKYRASEVVRDLFKYLGVNCDFKPGNVDGNPRVINKGSSPRSALAARLYPVVFSALNEGIWLPFTRLVGFRRAHLLKDYVGMRRTLARCFFRPGYPPMSYEERDLVMQRFMQEIYLLAEITGRDLRHWMVDCNRIE